MKIQPLKIGTKTAKVPVIQGGMGVGISLGNLAGAVAKEGGIGIISAAQPGFREEDFIKDPLKANLRAIKSEYEKARKIASDGIIGFNLMVAMEHYEEYVHAVVEAGADLIVSGAGLPTDLPKYVGESDILLAPIDCKIGKCDIKILGQKIPQNLGSGCDRRTARRGTSWIS